MIDDSTKMTIPFAHVTALGWRKVGSEEETYVKVDTITGENGAFNIRFGEAFKISIGSIAAGYHPNKKDVVDEKTNDASFRFQEMAMFRDIW